MAPGQPQRIGVVGGGIVGLALARELLARRPGIDLVVLEKEERVATHQTGRNSGVVHAGVYYEPGSLKARLCVAGGRMLRDYCAGHGLPFHEIGKLVVAVTADEEARLGGLVERARANGVHGVRLLGGSEIREHEPQVAGRAALLSPRSAIVDFAAVARQLAADVTAAGGEVRTAAEILDVRPAADGVETRWHGGTERFDRLVNCAGLQADRVAVLAGDSAAPRIVPFRGDYFVLRPAARGLVRGLVYPVPDPRYPFLGVHVTPRVDGEVLVGPNALLSLAREDYRGGAVRWKDTRDILGWAGFRHMARRHWRTGVTELRRSASRRFVAAEARRYVPALAASDLARGPCGIRAQSIDEDGTLVDDFRLSRCGPVTNVRNAPSPAATSSLALAAMLADEVLGERRTAGSLTPADFI
jgi:(S)-2-hydroxyglutarate dehydrogenase